MGYAPPNRRNGPEQRSTHPQSRRSRKCRLLFPQQTIKPLLFDPRTPSLFSANHCRLDAKPRGRDCPGMVHHILHKPHESYEGFHEWGYPGWMVWQENPTKIDDLGVPLFQETPTYSTYSPQQRNIANTEALAARQPLPPTTPTGRCTPFSSHNSKPQWAVKTWSVSKYWEFLNTWQQWV